MDRFARISVSFMALTLFGLATTCFIGKDEAPVSHLECLQAFLASFTCILSACWMRCCSGLYQHPDDL
jgi:hypothetical protein